VPNWHFKKGSTESRNSSKIEKPSFAMSSMQLIFKPFLDSDSLGYKATLNKTPLFWRIVYFPVQ
jgi:hypothetical protein